MLIGRDGELERLDRLLEAARDGRASSLLVVGEAGVGKTALLDAAAERASDFRLIRTRGIEAEAELSFAALGEVIRPLEAEIARLPAAQAAAVRGVLQLEAPEQQGASAASATLVLHAAAGEQQPLLVLVDDAQWLDEASGVALAFTARRLHDARVAIAFAARHGEEPRFSLDGVERMELEPLGTRAATALVVAANPSLDAATTDRIVASSGGNPLALLELPGLFAQAADASLPSVPVPAGEAARRLFGSRLDALGRDARTALLVAAAARSPDTEALLRAWEVLELDPVAIEAAERVGLVELRDQLLEFRHPLVRSLVYGEAQPPERRRAHAALAIALGPDPVARGEWAWHRALAAVGVDGEAADALAATAARQPPAAAAAALARAGRLTPDRELRAQRLVDAADAAYAAGEFDAARRLAADARSETVQVPTAAAAERVLALCELQQDRPREAVEGLVRAADAIGEVDRTSAARMLVEAVDACVATGQPERALACARRARGLARDADATTRLNVELQHADALAWTGRYREGQELALAAADDAAARPETADATLDFRVLLAETFLSGGDLARARVVAQAAVDEARAIGSLAALHGALATLFSVELWCGRAVPALAAAAEELELARGVASRWATLEALGHVAWAEALRGPEDECRRHVAERFELSVLGRADPIVHPALGLLELAVGRPEASVEALEPTVKVRADRGLADAVLPTPELPLLVEAYTRAGRRDAANDALRRFEHGADTSGRPLAHALAARCRGLLAATSEFEDEFERALVDDPLEPRPFELARTRLLYGERLRREKRGLAAREQLRAALTAFDEFGATLWSRRAAVELAATGERARRRPPPATDELTPQELVVARIVAQGKTNREVAAELFLSTNTIETHLRHIFRKLGVRSRTELAAKVTDFRDSNAAPSA